MKLKTILLAALAAAALLTGCTNARQQKAMEAVAAYNSAAQSYNASIAEYNRAASAAGEQHAALTAAIDDARAAAGEGTALEPDALDSLTRAIREAEDSRTDIPEPIPEAQLLTIPADAEPAMLDALTTGAQYQLFRLTQEVPPHVPAIPDHSGTIAALEAAAAEYRAAVLRAEKLNAPADDAVLAAVKKVPGILNAAKVTEGNDPNKQLNKDGGYIGAVIFAHGDVPGTAWLANAADYSVIRGKTDSGGTVEVFRTAQDAQLRDRYLEAFDGTVLDSGSHAVFGTVVIRTSRLLPADKQAQLTQDILAALLEE